MEDKEQAAKAEETDPETKPVPVENQEQAVEEVEEASKRFISKGPHVVHDNNTDVYWMKKDSWLEKGKYLNWHEGNDYALTKNIRKIGGFDDWRMPTADEAATLYDEELNNVAKGGAVIHIDKVFPENSFKAQWVSADTSTKRPRFDFTSGKILQVDEYNFGSVRLCRRDPVKRDDRLVRSKSKRR